MIKLRMKKVEPSPKKNASTHGAKQTQKKISVYFAKTAKDEVSEKRDNNTRNNIVETNLMNKKTYKKRKVIEDKESLKTQYKVAKYDISDIYNVQSIQRHKNAFKDESTVVLDVLKNDKASTSENNCKNTPISPKEDTIIEHDFKENINIDKCKDSLHELNEKKTKLSDIILIENNIMLHGNFNKNSSTEEHKRDFMEESQQLNKNSYEIKLSKQVNKSVFNNVKQLDEVNKLNDESNFESGTHIIDDFNDYFKDEWSVGDQLNFNSLQRCRVIDVKKECNYMLLNVEQIDFEFEASNAIIKCLGFWKDTRVEKGDIIVIEARKETEYWIVDNDTGFIVIHPDVLISGTTVVSGLFCSRKAVLAEKFRKMENLPYYNGDKTAVVVGSLVHQLLQKAVSQNICKLTDITNLMDCILQSKETIDILYASEITFDACRQHVLAYVPKIFEFIQHYFKDKKQQNISNMKNNFNGKITHVHDIEENIWLPKIGMKGKVDLTVEVNVNSKRKTMPLEIKTGKPSFSLEHKGQIILYIMMMALTGQDTDTGLLLYLRENNMQEINSRHPERRDLILLRNTLASYFAPKSAEKLSDSTYKVQTLKLPEPINHYNACSKCPYNVLCCAYLIKDTKVQLSDSHPLMKLSKQILDKFKPEHIDYILQWVSLLQIEESAQSKDNIITYLWTLSPEKREIKKTCICNLKVIGKVIKRDSKYQHTFVRINANVQISSTNIPYLEFAENEYILINTDTRINIAAGFIVSINKDSINILLDRDITKYNINESFHIDKYSSSSLLSFNLANVGGLMGNDEICIKLRNIVIDRKSATFDKILPQSVIHKSSKILRNLNENQQKAVLKAMTANDYILIKGMPGTGKTQTLVALIELLYETGFSVLITAHTNNAVDNILLKLLDKGIDFLRLGSSSTHPSLKHKSEKYATANCCSLESLETVYSSKNIVGVTCYGAHHALFLRRTFDICIVDESAQALQPTVLRPLYSARKFVLVGDPDQLPPIIKSKLARKLGADESLFARLDTENNTVNLIKQYRMNKNIMRLANTLTYNDRLRAGNTLIENATFSATHSENLMKQEKWIQKVLSQHINDSVIVLNTGCTSNLKVNGNFNYKYPENDHVHSNIWEAAIVSKLVQTLIEMDVKIKDVGIIAPYRAHVNLLRTIVHNDIEVNTVDQYQGRDKEIIFYSCAKSLINSNDIKEDLEVLGDHRRLTVAITRAKCKLIVIADKHTLSQYSAFKKLFNLIEDRNTINLIDYCDFSWEHITSML